MADLIVDVDAAVVVPVNRMPLVSSSDFITTDETIAYNESGMDLNWNFVTTAGVVTQTNVTPTTGGVYDWAHTGNAMYSIEIPASGGGSINNDTEGFGWFSGVCDGVLPWVSPTIQFSPAALVASLVDTAPSNVLFVDFGGVPSVIVTPKTGTDTFDMRFESRDHNNQLVAPDSVTVTLVDQDGTDLSSRLDDTTPSAVSTGLYEIVYTATAADAAAQLKLGVTLTKSGYVGDKQHYSINLVDAAALVNANVTQVNGTSQTAYDIGGNLGAPVGEESISAMILSNTGIGQSIETDTQDIQSRLPAALTGAGNIKADALAVSGSTTAADNAEVVFDTDFASNYNTTADKWNASVTHYGGTAGTFASGLPDVNVRTHQGHRTHYLAASGGNDSNPGTRALPLATFSQAMTNAVYGDTVILLAGTYTSAINVSKAGIRVLGEGVGVTLVVVATTGSVIELEDDCELGYMSVINSHSTSGGGVGAQSEPRVYIHDLAITGVTDTIWYVGDFARIENVVGTSSYDGLQLTGANNVLVENCRITCDGAKVTGGAVSAAALLGPYTTVRNCLFSNTRSTATSSAEHCYGASTSGPTLFDNTKIIASQANAGGSGNAIGIYAGDASSVTMLGGNITNSQAGGGSNYELMMSHGDSRGVLIGTRCDGLFSGVVQQIDTDLASTLADTAELQGDWANGGRLDLLIDDVPTNSELATAISSGLATYDPPTKAEMDSAISAISGSAETRDLREASKPNQWEMVQRSGGVISLNPITIYQGETKTVGFDCSRIMSASDVLATMGTPTASDEDLTPTKIGIGPKWANLTLAAAADTTAGTGYTVSCTVTTDEGGGPIVLIGNVTVVDD